MGDPKITKFKGGYLADAKLMFQSWHADIVAHIQDHELDNKATIQLIKDMTLDSGHREVGFQLNLCSGIISYQDLLKHLSITFQGGDEEANSIGRILQLWPKVKRIGRSFC